MMQAPLLTQKDFEFPAIMLSGIVDHGMYLHFRNCLSSACIASRKAMLHEIEASIAIQNEGFANLILGSQVTMDELLQRAPENWYLEVNEAQAIGLVAAVI